MTNAEREEMALEQEMEEEARHDAWELGDR
jgi:hypothetical protein